MKNELIEIITKYEDLQGFLKNLSIETFKKCTRKELIEFQQQLDKVSFRCLSNEISEIINNKKVEEYPELLGIYRYPEIKEIDFISEDDKLALDKYLEKLGVNSFLYTGSYAWEKLSEEWTKDISEKILLFLYEKNTLKRVYKYYHCNDYCILTRDEIDIYLRYFELKNKDRQNIELSESEWDEFYEIESSKSFTLWCSSCDYETEITEELLKNILNNVNCYQYILIKDKNTFYDNL